MPEGVREEIIEGMYLLKEGAAGDLRVQLLGSGAILREVIAASELLKEDWGVESDVFSVTSFNELGRNGVDAERFNLLNPEKTPKLPIITRHLAKRSGPVIAATDYIRAYADQVRAFVPHRYKVLGTDGFGRSDTRVKLREFFEVNRHYVAVAALKSLAEDGKIQNEQVSRAIKKYGLDPHKPNPARV
jgi:pyruvate dehydrogenase E1 component